MSEFLIVLGGVCWIAALHQRLAVPEAPWKDSWGAYAIRGSVFLLGGMLDFAPELWGLFIVAAALGLMTLSAVIDSRRSRLS